MPVDYRLESSVAVMTMDDGRANALGPDSIAEIEAGLDRAVAEESRAVVLAGRPGRFSAGFDLSVMQSGPQEMRELVKAGGRLSARVLLHPAPVVAACTGHALAAGALLLLASDHRVGATGTWKIGLNEVAIGMPMPRWGVELARYRLRPSELDWRLVLGQTASPDEAVAAGFLDRLVEADAVVSAAIETATALSQLRRGAVEGTKRRVRGEVAERMLHDMDGDLADVTVPG